MKSLLSYIIEQLSEETIVATLNVDGNIVSIIDIPNFDNTGCDARALSDETGYYSVIYKDKNIHNQPSYLEIQKRFMEDCNKDTVHNVLILGGGGCAIPRFFLLEYPQDTVTTVELSQDLIDASNQYFLNDLTNEQCKKHKLIQADAFKFVDNEKANTYDFIFVDIFNGSNLIEDVFSEKFINQLNRIVTKNGIIAYNIGLITENESLDKVKNLFKDKNIQFYTADTYNYLYIQQ